MIRVILIENPFDPHHNLHNREYRAGSTIREWLSGHFGPRWEEFPVPTLCQLNGQPMLRETWDTTRLQDGDVLSFTTIPGEVVSIVIAVIAIVVAVAAVMLMPDPKVPSDQSAKPGNSVYTLRGQTNRYRPSEPIEVVYGKCRIWPTLIARPYTRYIDNKCYQYSLFCVGQGEFDIEAMRLDDTNTSTFNEVEVEVCPPGVEPQLIDTAVYAATEVSNIELLAPDAAGYTGHSGPFVLNDSDKPIKRIEVDISFPQGLYKMSKEGDLMSQTVELKFRAQEIDSSGAAVGSWFWLYGNPANDDRLTITRSVNTPQRITKSQAVPRGRYRIEGWRVTNKPPITREIDQTMWETAKGYGKELGSFPGVTVITMKAMATNQLNDQTSQKFNLTATRKLPTWNSTTGWSALTVTRNPVWAFCDVMRAQYGLRLEDQYLDLPALYDLAQLFDSKGITFDWVFDESMTPWEAARTILRVGRAMPVPHGSLVTAIRDEAQTLPAAMFNQHNIIQGSLTKQLALFDHNPYDSLIVEYTDPLTWSVKEIHCVMPGFPGVNPDRLRLPGCTSRSQAKREGMYTLSRRLFQRKTITFRTGLEGHIPTLLDMVMVTHDTVRVGQSGMVVAYNSATNEMTLSQQVEFGGASLPHKIQLRGSDGAPMGSPISVTPGASANKVILASDPPEALVFDLDQAPPLYAFGVSNLLGFMGKVSSIRPVDNQSVEITLLNYVPSSYDHDDYIEVEVDQLPVIRDSANLQVPWVNLYSSLEVPNRVNVTFGLVPGAVAYVVEISYDGGTTWSSVGTFERSPVQLAVAPGALKVRVAPFSVSGGLIYTTSSSFTAGSVPVAPVVTVGTPSGSNYPLTWTHTKDDMFLMYKVYASGTTGFTPTSATLVDDTTTKAMTVTKSGTTYVLVGTVNSDGKVAYCAEFALP